MATEQSMPIDRLNLGSYHGQVLLSEESRKRIVFGSFKYGAMVKNLTTYFQFKKIIHQLIIFLRCVSFVGNSTRNHSACRRFIMDMFTFVERFLPDSPHGECHVSSFPDQIEQHSLLRCNKSQAQVWYRPKSVIDHWFRVKTSNQNCLTDWHQL